MNIINTPRFRLEQFLNNLVVTNTSTSSLILNVTYEDCSGNIIDILEDIEVEDTYTISLFGGNQRNGRYKVNIRNSEGATYKREIYINNWYNLLYKTIKEIRTTLCSKCEAGCDECNKNGAKCIKHQNLYNSLLTLVYFTRPFYISGDVQYSDIMSRFIQDAVDLEKCYIHGNICKTGVNTHLTGEVKFGEELFKHYITLNYLALYFYHKYCINTYTAGNITTLNSLFLYREISKCIGHCTDINELEELFVNLIEEPVIPPQVVNLPPDSLTTLNYSLNTGDTGLINIDYLLSEYHDPENDIPYKFKLMTTSDKVIIGINDDEDTIPLDPNQEVTFSTLATRGLRYIVNANIETQTITLSYKISDAGSLSYPSIQGNINFKITKLAVNKPPTQLTNIFREVQTNVLNTLGVIIQSSAFLLDYRDPENDTPFKFKLTQINPGVSYKVGQNVLSLNEEVLFSDIITSGLKFTLVSSTVAGSYAVKYSMSDVGSQEFSNAEATITVLVTKPFNSAPTKLTNLVYSPIAPSTIIISRELLLSEYEDPENDNPLNFKVGNYDSNRLKVYTGDQIILPNEEVPIASFGKDTPLNVRVFEIPDLQPVELEYQISDIGSQTYGNVKGKLTFNMTSNG